MCVCVCVCVGGGGGGGGQEGRGGEMSENSSSFYQKRKLKHFFNKM